MIPGLGTFYDRLDQLFGKNYLIVGFVPALVFFIFSALLLLYLDVGPVTAYFDKVSIEKGLDQTLSWVSIGILVAFIGYVIWSLNAAFREFLEGRYLLPDWLRKKLEIRQQAKRDDLRGKLKGLHFSHFKFREHMGMDPLEAVNSPEEDARAQAQWVNQLNLEKISENKDDPRTESLDFASSINEAEQKLIVLEASKQKRELIPFKDVVEVFDLLKDCAPIACEEALSKEEKRKWIRGKSRLLEVAWYGRVRAETDWDKYSSEMFFHFPNESANLGPTAIANMSEIHRNYGKERYEMEVDMVWPRLQAIVAADTAFSALLNDSKIKLDFAVSMTAISALFAFLSMVPLGLYAESNWPFFVVPAVAVGFTLIFYHLAVRAYRAWGEVLRSAIDLFRFKLLDQLQVQKPRDSNEEKVIWKRLMEVLLLRSDETVEYKHGDD